MPAGRSGLESQGTMAPQRSSEKKTQEIHKVSSQHQVQSDVGSLYKTIFSKVSRSCLPLHMITVRIFCGQIMASNGIQDMGCQH